MVVKCFAYLRVSANSQIDKGGIPRQKESLLQFAKKNDYSIEKFFRDKGVSGTLPINDRPAFKEMLGDLLTGEIKTVLVEHIDRFSRSDYAFFNILYCLIRNNIELITANTGENIVSSMLNSDDPMKKALIKIQSTISELEKDSLVLKLRKARERKKKLTGKCEGRKSLFELNPSLRSDLIKIKRKPRLGKKPTLKQISIKLNQMGYPLYDTSQISRLIRRINGGKKGVKSGVKTGVNLQVNNG